MKNRLIIRWILYGIGIVVLALGLTLNTKSGLGVSPIISVAYLFSDMTGNSFGNVTFVYYCVFVGIELIMDHDWKDLLQIPFSVVFTGFLNLFGEILVFRSDSFQFRLFLLILAVVCTGIGAALTVNMKIVPNPGDGIVNAIARHMNKEMGITKNFFDATCITVTLILGFLSGRPFCGIGIGTVVAMIGVGRVISAFNHVFREKLAEISGTE